MINKRIYFSIAIVITTLSVIIVLFLRSPSAPQTPCAMPVCNVIFIVLDTVGARHMSMYGNSRITTPFIDTYFGKHGTVFDHAWSVAPWTLPSFTAMFTGYYPSEVGRVDKYDQLPDTISTLFDILRTRDVDLAAFLAFRGQRDSADFTMSDEFLEHERFIGGDPLQFLAARTWIDTRAANSDHSPFFLLLHSAAVQPPYRAPDPYRALFDAKTNNDDTSIARLLAIERKHPSDTSIELDSAALEYDRELRYTDDLVNDFLSSLPDSIADHTAIIITGDHGESFGEHGIVSHGYSLYEELLHVPLAIRMPGARQMRVNEPVSLMSVMPTILDLFGMKDPSPRTAPSLLAATRGESFEGGILRAERTADPFHYGATRRISRPSDASDAYTLRDDNWKLIGNAAGKFELYDLAADPLELRDRIGHWRTLSATEQLRIQSLIDLAAHVGQSRK